MTSGTKEWMPNSANCIIGCRNDCRYCYAKKNAIRFNRRTKENWHTEVLRTEAKTKLYKGGVMFPTTHDLKYEHKNWWMPFLTELLKKGNDILIVSKPEYAAIEYIDQNLSKYQDQIEFRFSIGTNDDTTRQFWEPHAPTIEERIKCLNYVYEAGYYNSVSMEPLLMHNPEPFIQETLERRVSGNIWIGLMNHMRISDFSTGEIIWYNRQQYSINSMVNIREVYELLKNNPKIRWKDSIQELLGVTNPA